MEEESFILHTSQMMELQMQMEYDALLYANAYLHVFSGN